MGALTGPNPVDRGKLGPKYYLLVDGRGIRLAVGLSAANTHCDDPGGGCGEGLTQTPTGLVPLSRSVGRAVAAMLTLAALYCPEVLIR